ncbi:ParA family protein [Mucilaginibacter ginkgonis]|uniref:ParA family protein n=1 Tax=Mucilaginibacter ginkgonis TaxID=2682091 RepID=A0A6I4IMI1_9SPHI|nr:ParA family protein [Mucilaginibacter ginkgonis]QQL50280.1 ParA family protein [Mucilaginibacter ginkgonis]
MAKVITIAHQKGGVGKSTLAINLALCFQDHLSVAVIDTDLQGSLYHIKEDFAKFSIGSTDDVNGIPTLPQDLAIVDTAPYLSNRLPALFLASDFILVPTKAGFFDVMAVRSTLALIEEAQRKKPSLKAGIVLNMVKPRSGITQDVISLLKDMNIPLLQTVIHDRVSITRSSLTGGIMKTGDRKAISEITSLAEELVTEISDR